MAAITTRQTAGTGATVKNLPLTNTEVDTNFINLNVDVLSRVSKSGDTVTGTLNIRSTQGFVSPSATRTITATMLDSGQLSWSGSSGQLFSITDSLTGTLFSVNDVSGIPSIEVLDTGLVKIAQYNGNTLFGTGVDNATDKVQIVGTASIVANSTGTALRITQTGTGAALRVEDSANPDSTSFIIGNDGTTIVGGTPVVGGGNSYPVFQVTGYGDGTIGANAAAMAINGFLPSGAGGFFGFNRSNSATVGTNTIVANGDQIGRITWSGADGTNYIRSAQISAEVDGAPGTNDMPGRLIFSTTADGASTLTERVRIDSSGNVGINDSSPSTRGRLSVIGTDGGRRFVVTAAGLTQARYDDNSLPSILTLQNHGMTGANQGAAILWTLGNSDTNSQNAAAIKVLAESTWDATTASRDSAMVFSTTLDGNLTDRVRIDSAGRIGFGGSPYAGTNYYFARNITGATTVDVILQAGTVQSDVTASANIFTSFTGTAASSFTLSNLRHFTAEQATFGSGSTVTNQYGYQAGATLIGATNNFGFHSNIPSGTNRWNFYAQGTARNLFTGNTGIGADSGNEIKLLVGGNATGTTSELGLRISETVLSDVTSSYIGVDSLLSTQAATFTLGGYSAYRAGIGTRGAGSNITTIQGYVALANLAVGTNNYAFRGSFASAANTFNLYMDGTADNHFNSRLLIGRTYSGNERIGIGGSTSTAGESGIYNDTTIGSATTTAYTAFNSYLSTAAASFTLGNLTHYNANQFTIGAGSTVTNQYGFFASNLTGATNNFGFHSNVASGTNRWNFYAAGTANNYLAGNLWIDVTSASEKLYVKQTATQYTAIFENTSNDGVARGISIRSTANNVPVLNISRWYNTFPGNADVGQIRFDGLTTSSTYAEHAAIYAVATGANSTTGAPTRLSFRTSDGTNSSTTERMTISATGIVNIAATTASTSTTTGALVVSGGIGVAENSYFAKALVVGTALAQATAIDLNNNNIVGVNAFTFADPGPNEGISFNGNFNIYESPDDLTTNTAGNLQFVSGGARRLTVKTSGQVEIPATTASTSTTTGALVVSGGVGIAGALNATTKSFIIDHPTKPGKLLKHGSLEGPEFGVYVRGRLKDTNMVVLPEYWTKLVDPTTITVNLTPIGSHQELYVEDIVDNVVFVKNSNLFNKTINCFYTVFAERMDVDKLEVEVD